MALFSSSFVPSNVATLSLNFPSSVFPGVAAVAKVSFNNRCSISTFINAYNVLKPSSSFAYWSISLEPIGEYSPLSVLKSFARHLSFNSWVNDSSILGRLESAFLWSLNSAVFPEQEKRRDKSNKYEYLCFISFYLLTYIIFEIARISHKKNKFLLLLL